MFGFRQDSRNSSQRALVPVTDQIAAYEENADANEDLNLRDEGSPGMTYADVVNFVRRKKCMLAFIATGILIFLGLLLGTICVTASGSAAPVIDPTTPAPLTTSLTPSTTTQSTTTPSTTTSSTTTPSTTTQSTTTPSTTTSSTTTPSTTTSSTTPPTTTKSPSPALPTVHPLPPDAASLPPTTLIDQVFTGKTNFTEDPCLPTHPPAFRFTLTIVGISKNYTGESDRVKRAKTAASMNAATDLFGITYHDPMPKPVYPCVPVKDSDNTTHSSYIQEGYNSNNYTDDLQETSSANPLLINEKMEDYSSTTIDPEFQPAVPQNNPDSTTVDLQETSTVTQLMKDDNRNIYSSTTPVPDLQPPVPTVHPLPPDAGSLPPTTLIEQVFTGKANFTEDHCTPTNPPAWRFTLVIRDISKNYTADSDSKTHARTAASMLAAEDLFGIKYNYTMPKPIHPCVPFLGTIDPRALKFNPDHFTKSYQSTNNSSTTDDENDLDTTTTRALQ